MGLVFRPLIRAGSGGHTLVEVSQPWRETVRRYQFSGKKRPIVGHVLSVGVARGQSCKTSESGSVKEAG